MDSLCNCFCVSQNRRDRELVSARASSDPYTDNGNRFWERDFKREGNWQHCQEIPVALCGVGRMIFYLSMCVGVIRNYKPEVHMLTWAISETLVWFIV